MLKHIPDLKEKQDQYLESQHQFSDALRLHIVALDKISNG